MLDRWNADTTFPKILIRLSLLSRRCPTSCFSLAATRYEIKESLIFSHPEQSWLIAVNRNPRMDERTFLGQRFGYFHTGLVLEFTVDPRVGTEFLAPPFAFEPIENPRR